MATLTAALVDSASGVELVVAEDFPAATAMRLESSTSPVLDSADRERVGSGAACTFAPSTTKPVCVVFNGSLVSSLVTGVGAWTDEDQVKLYQTVIHEAQHVIQFQRDRWGGAEDGVCGDDFLALIEDAAARLCDEYAAIWNEVRITDRVFDIESMVSTTLEHLDANLDVAARKYSAAEDFDDLCAEVLESAYAMWFMLTYWSAVFEGMDEVDGDDLVRHKLWARYVGSTGFEIFSATQAIPAAELMIEPTDFDNIVRQLISVLRASLDRIGRELVRRLSPDLRKPAQSGGHPAP